MHIVKHPKPKIFGIIPFLALYIMVMSCSQENYNDSDFVAGETFTNSNIQLYHIDTLSVETSTMKFDSILTSESTRILVGRYHDSIFGTVNASGFMQFLPSTYSIDTEAQFDSIVFIAGYDNYYYNDTLQKNTIEIKRISEQLKPADGDNFYNTSTITHDEENLGSIEYYPRPISGDSIRIKLMDHYGTDIFDQLQEKNIVNTDEYIDRYKGIAMVPRGSDNGSIIGFSKSADRTFVRLYYSIPTSEESVQGYLDIRLNTTSTPIPFFNQITADAPIPPLQTLINSEINLASAASNNQSYIQSGIGIAMRLQFPNMSTLFDIPGNGTILDGVLKIKPAPLSYSDELILSDSLAVYVVDHNNVLTEQLSISGSAVYAILNKENQEFNDIYYQLPLAFYLEELQLKSRDKDDALILLPINYNSTVDRFVLNANGNGTNETILELTYAIYDEEE
ncbi:DUF4270 family protein [Maribacter confluentis]|uniref:DUF4270 family protein n=1 Tax=Maribacter confluentis TaxID=1656093 RepID=A0ABT8RLC1_9FLAO|nr:DUF4270 family protein [Maribacter confluentis]MDO1511730.1 DUF4270 family protein [Maribacter confluentis]